MKTISDLHFVQPLLAWYQTNRRQLPWRINQDPYRIWVSEIMLQQTKVEAVIPYYERFLREFPDIATLASASEDAILKAWQGLGYYSRVRNMQVAARQMQAQYQGQFPKTRAEILALKGIGSYTASAIASISFSERTPAVDGNVLRVVARFIGYTENVLEPTFKQDVFDMLLPIMPAQSGDLNQAIMDLGASVCTPGTPKCDICPLRQACQARQLDQQNILPIRKIDTVKKEVQKAVLLLRTQDMIAIRKRGEGLLANMYEFPNVDVDDAGDRHSVIMTLSQAFPALSEHLDRLELLGKDKHVFTHIIWHMHVYRLSIPHPIQLEKVQYADLKRLSAAAIPTAFRKLFPYIDML